MKRPKGSDATGFRRLKLSHILLGTAGFYLIFISLKFPRFLEIANILSNTDSFISLDQSTNRRDTIHESPSFNVFHQKLEDNENQNPPQKEPFNEDKVISQPSRPLKYRYGRITNRTDYKRIELSELEKIADEAWTLGLKAWEEIGEFELGENNDTSVVEEKPENCPSSVSVSGEELEQNDHLMFLPCGLAAGSSITMIGTPHNAHEEYVARRGKSRQEDSMVLISQFIVELQGLKAVDGEDPPRILHLNPRIRGDWSRNPVIEHNTCYRMQWGMAQRCDGLPSKNKDDKVDGFGKCEKWIRSDVLDSKESKTTSWLRRFIGRAKKPEITWPFPFVEGRLFVLTLRASVDGYHINVGGRHVTSFPYRTGFTLEDATGLAVKGDVNVHSIYATSLPLSHPSFSLQKVLDMAKKWKSSTLPDDGPVHLFIGILSATNHFAERMAIRKTWMQSPAIRSSNVVARFFVALNSRKEVNAVLMKEAEYFGDIVILPFMDRYELVVLKTIAICEYGVHNLSAAYIMKCDDDTFVRVDSVLTGINGVSPRRPLYMGNLNLLHRPLRSGKWAVTYEEWPEEVYPPYANGPGYVISSDIARSIVSQHFNQSLRLFKMEDVSMGLWVEQFNGSTAVHYSHSWKFCQYGCMEDYYTAHYQSPRQMTCLWDKLARGKAHCCNFR